MNYDAEVAIIGAGPLGLELAAALKIAGISYLQFDKGQAAQMIENFPFQTPFFSSTERIGIAGIPIQTDNQQKCMREHYLAYIRSVIMHYGLILHSYEEVTSIQRASSDSFQLKTVTLAGQHTYTVRFVVIATGSTSSHKLLHIPGEELPHVSVKMQEPHRYFQKRVAIIGGKNSAAESALRCFNAGAHVTLVVRADELDSKSIKYWIYPELKSRIEKGEICCYTSTEVQEILLSQLKVRNHRSGEVFDIPVDFVVKAIGFDADMRICRELGVVLSEEDKSPKYDMETMETAAKDVFVLGTVIGGSQKRYRIFIENTHIHVRRIVNALCGRLDKESPSLEGWFREAVLPSKLEE